MIPGSNNVETNVGSQQFLERKIVEFDQNTQTPSNEDSKMTHVKLDETHA